MTEENKNIPAWIIYENEELDKQSNYEGKKLPAIQFKENKITSFSVDFTEKFGEYDDKDNNCKKAIIPVTDDKGEDKILWLNKKNPLYREIMVAGKNGITEFKVLQTGTKQNTKYNLVKD